jgi:hypothetical protein
VQTASSFDLNWVDADLTLKTSQVGSSTAAVSTPVSSQTGLELDYNVALFDYRSAVSFSFMQFETSNAGKVPISRLAFGYSYYLFRINGQRVILDNQVEGKTWGVAPALELSVGINRLTINNKDSGGNLDFTAGVIDAIPRLLIEIPLSSSFLLMLRGGTYLTLKGSSSLYAISLGGGVFSVGFKLTTL